MILECAMIDLVKRLRALDAVFGRELTIALVGTATILNVQDWEPEHAAETREKCGALFAALLDPQYTPHLLGTIMAKTLRENRMESPMANATITMLEHRERTHHV